jgi:2-keto-4-pentenoate hydratase
MTVSRRDLALLGAACLAAPGLASSSLAAPRGAEPLRGQRLRAGDIICCSATAISPGRTGTGRRTSTPCSATKM